ncbi:hypothetical protein GVX82_03795 [Patescibacteria group bacterium]|jgi:flagellar biosynthesis protein FlhB|nr:hypothetical protein [Patescibacteria group bacterium]
MAGAQVALFYFSWHYGRGIRDFLRTWGNLVWFFWHFFAIPLMARTLFMAFRRIETSSRPGFHPDDMAGNLIVNVLMRLLGFFLKMLLILIGLSAILATLLLGGALFLFWLVAPVALVLMLVLGLLYLLF